VITLDEFRGNLIVAGTFADVDDVTILSAQELAMCYIAGLDCIMDSCRVQVWSLAIAHTIELTMPGCGVPLTGVKKIKNEADQVEFGAWSVSNLEATRWGFLLKELLRKCTCRPSIYQTDPTLCYHGGGCCV
jgi:hypothetical protein